MSRLSGRGLEVDRLRPRRAASQYRSVEMTFTVSCVIVQHVEQDAGEVLEFWRVPLRGDIRALVWIVLIPIGIARCGNWDALDERITAKKHTPDGVCRPC